MTEWPKNITFTLEHNPHKAVYQSVEDFINGNPFYSDLDVGNKKKCIEADEIWILQYYPHTPIGFHVILSHSWEDLKEQMNDTM